MRVFVLTIGRTGSVTFFKACEHITNFTSHHEVRVAGLPASRRAASPDQSIAVDPRLCWMLGHLDHRYGNEAFYVHLIRQVKPCAESWARRFPGGPNESLWTLVEAWRTSILQGAPEDRQIEIATDLVTTADFNIASFLKDKPRQLRVRLEHGKEDFAVFWRAIKAEGDLDAALAEWDTRHNASE
jgi:hypothetical protein